MIRPIFTVPWAWPAVADEGCGRRDKCQRANKRFIVVLQFYLEQMFTVPHFRNEQRRERFSLRWRLPCCGTVLQD